MPNPFTWTYEHVIRPPAIWTYRHGIRPVVNWPRQPGLNLGSRILRGAVSYGLLPIALTYLVYSTPGTIFNWPYAIGSGREVPTERQRVGRGVPFDTPLIINSATFDKQLQLTNLDFVSGSVTLNAYSVKGTDDCQRGGHQQGESLSNFLRRYEVECKEGGFTIIIPFLTGEEVNRIRDNMHNYGKDDPYNYSTIVLTQSGGRKTYPASVCPRSIVDFPVVARQTPSGLEIVADIENVRFLDGVDSEVFERVPFRQQESLNPGDVQERPRK